MDKLVFIGAFLTYISYVSSLECFHCNKEDNNHHGCVQDTKQCLEYQDACITYIRWGVPPYWTPRADRIYFITKGCDTATGCEATKGALRTHCKRDWYRDWACVECCNGDLCNYHVTYNKQDYAYWRSGAEGMGAGHIKAGYMAFLSVLSTFLIMKNL